MHPILNIGVKAARNASKIMLQAMDRLNEVKVSEKQRNDFVTEVDKKVEIDIIETIRKAYPQHSFLAEESGEIAGDADHVWIIDPLDGTNNFIHGFPQFAISIAYQLKGKIEHGVIYDPVRDELFTASRGEGAKLNNRRIRVSDCQKLEKALIGTGFPFKYIHKLPQYMQALTVLYPKISDIRRAGSAALDLAYVAAGRLDGHWEMGLQIWDMAAGVLLIREAGGFINDFANEENYLKSGNIITATPKIFNKKYKEILGATWLLQTVGRMDAAVKPTGMYLRRVCKSQVAPRISCG